MKAKAFSYINLEVLSKEYKDFLLQKFEVGNLFYINEDVQQLFIEWSGKNMEGWYKVVNIYKDITFNFFSDEYKIFTKTKTGTFPFPRNLNDFISDCERMNIDLYWNIPYLDTLFPTKIYMKIDDMKQYYKELLTKIGKSDVF